MHRNFELILNRIKRDGFGAAGSQLHTESPAFPQEMITRIFESEYHYKTIATILIDKYK